jgi:hypothetical protein
MRLAISATRAIFALASPPQKWPGAPSVKRKEKKSMKKFLLMNRKAFRNAQLSNCAELGVHHYVVHQRCIHQKRQK